MNFDDLERVIEVKDPTSKKVEPYINSNCIIPQNKALSIFDKFVMNKTKREELKNMKFVIDGLIVDGYHTYLYGPAGAGKTTIILHLCYKMVENNYNVMYFYLDGTLQTASQESENIERKGIQDRFKILTDGNMGNYIEIFKDMINRKEDLSNVVFVIDTFKFLTRDVNNKNANKEAMHLIKDVCKLGATVISLGHTNKNGENASGTAEMEQDSDGVLRIDSLEEKDKNIATIKKGGRCRFDVQEQSFEYKRGIVSSVESINESLDIEALNRQKEQEQEDKYFISEVQKIMRLQGPVIQKELIEKLNENGLGGKNKILKKLNLYNSKYWTIRDGETTSSKVYHIIDQVENMINDIEERIQG